MALFRNKRNGDVVTVPTELEKKYAASNRWEKVTPKAAAKSTKSGIGFANKDAEKD